MAAQPAAKPSDSADSYSAFSKPVVI